LAAPPLLSAPPRPNRQAGACSGDRVTWRRPEQVIVANKWRKARFFAVQAQKMRLNFKKNKNIGERGLTDFANSYLFDVYNMI
jgi:hypothetical protein